MDPYAGTGGGDASSVVLLNSIEDIDSFLLEHDQDPAVLGYFDTPAHADELEIFKQV